MKMKHFILLIGALLFLATSAFSQQTSSLFLSPQFVDLKGKQATTVIENTSNDTLKLSGMFFNWLPYIEHNINLIIAPGQSDTLKFDFNYPDFIYFNNQFTILNGPGGNILCRIREITNKFNATFEGDYRLENNYYQAYHNYLGNYDNESRSYYNAGNTLNDFNRFPAIADSITNVRQAFLSNYKSPLDSWFKKHEYWRLTYNGIFRKYNVLLSKEFYGGKKINVNDSYYDFEKTILLKNADMIINTDYLWATNAYFAIQSKKVTRPTGDPILYAIDSIAKGDSVADILKMRYLPMLYMHDKGKYDAIFAGTHFYNLDYKLAIDSLIQSKLGLPKLGKPVPKIELRDTNDKLISLADYAGKNVIINFWAVWCGPCIAEFPVENRLAAETVGTALVIVNICVDSEKPSWLAISKKHNLQMVNLYCDAATYQSLKTKFNIGALPRSILINRQQRVTDNYYKRASLISKAELSAITR